MSFPSESSAVACEDHKLADRVTVIQIAVEKPAGHRAAVGFNDNIQTMGRVGCKVAECSTAVSALVSALNKDKRDLRFPCRSREIKTPQVSRT